MKEKYHMASTAIEGNQEVPSGQANVKKCLEEAVYFCFEAKLSDDCGDLTLQEGIKRASIDLKIQIMKTLKNQKNNPNYLKN
ncbi:hypothetical protein M153_8590002514 [Pseudoloma neurophilia]|uniref:Uncharacterized protein n=1 Tax=Pseudoloma neurophilia TaxID=146866 RepID=A0A0R0LWA0_9MICR|nr:hypothetical protein M153_8590002514 [Pseudoloma neurophilia]